MKFAEKENEVFFAGFSGQKSFGIVFDRKMVQILSKGLYSDPLSSCIREVSSNCYDAHKALEIGVYDGDKVLVAPVPGASLRPFELTLPSYWNNHTVTFRDYGTGIHPDNIHATFCVYGSSTKTSTNEQLGGFGFGCKSPFAVTDTFSVINFYNGMKYIYNVMLGEDGVPSLMPCGEEETIEENGLEISFSIKSSDSSAFIQKAQKIFRYFPVKPIIKDGTLNIPENNIVLSGKNWRYVSNYERNVASAIIGIVEYPIETTYFKYDDLTQDVRNILNVKGLQINFNIGELELQPSRENLSYSSETCSKIIERANEVLDEFKSSIQEKIELCANYYDACKTLYGFKNNTSNIYNIIVSDPSVFFYNNISLSYSITADLSSFYKETIDESNALKSVIKTDTASVDVYHKKFKKTIDKKTYYIDKIHITFDTDNIFVINDVIKPRVQSSHIRGMKQNIGENRYYIIEADDDSILSEVLAHFGNPETVLLSSFPQVKVVYNKVGMQFFTFNTIYYNNATRKSWIINDNIDIDDEETDYYYVPTIRGIPEYKYNGNTYTYENNFGEFLKSSCKLFSISDKNIISANEALVLKIANKDNWHNLFDMVIDYYKNNKIIDNNKEIDIVMNGIRKYGNVYYMHEFIDFLNIINCNNNVIDFFNSFENRYKTAVSSEYRVFLNRIEAFNDNKEFEDKIDKYINDIFGKYPMLKYIPGKKNINKNDVLDYIKMIDNQA